MGCKKLATNCVYIHNPKSPPCHQPYTPVTPTHRESTQENLEITVHTNHVGAANESGGEELKKPMKEK